MAEILHSSEGLSEVTLVALTESKTAAQAQQYVCSTIRFSMVEFRCF